MPSSALARGCSSTAPATPVPEADAPAWSVQTVDRWFSGFTQLWGINDAGDVVGSSLAGGFLWRQGVFEDLPAPAGARYATPFGISNQGLVVGTWCAAGSNRRRGFLAIDGVCSVFDFLPEPDASTLLRGISPDGRYLTGSCIDTRGRQRGFAIDRCLGTVSTTAEGLSLQGGNRAGLVAAGAALFDVGTGQCAPLPRSSQATPRCRAINDEGLMAGFCSRGGPSRAVVGTLVRGFHELPLSQQAWSVAQGLNGAGDVVGCYQDLQGRSRGFLATRRPG